MGSVKDLIVIKEPTSLEQGKGIFIFSDRYSVFDWGEMPNHIKKKGACLAMIGAYNFEMLERKGIKTHYLGLIDSKGKTCTVSELIQKKEISNKMLVRLVRKISPESNYANYLEKHDNYLVPLEIIFRNGLPRGSSIFKKIDELKNKPEKLKKMLFSLGLLDLPAENHWLSNPVYDFSTKLEEQDRTLSYEESLRISGLAFEEFAKVMQMAATVNNEITTHCSKIGLKHWDGKIEVGFFKGNIVLLDVCGTPDESRISMNGIQISKQPMREYYKKTEWYKDIERAKKEATQIGEGNWKKLCKLNPERLPIEIKNSIEDMYKAATNHWLSAKIFDVAHLKSALENMNRQFQKYITKEETKND